MVESIPAWLFQVMLMFVIGKYESVPLQVKFPINRLAKIINLSGTVV
jgi:hypothetical protein